MRAAWGRPPGAGVCGVALKGKDMLHRVLSLAAALALVGFVGVAVAADKAAPVEKDNNTHNVTIVKVEGNNLTVTGKDGKEHTHAVAKDATITCDGKECKLDDLKKDDKAVVTLAKEKGADTLEITKIEATREKK